jgi:hypothetical protein
MAEAVTIVCDVCGSPAVETVKISTKDRTVVKDLCGAHRAEAHGGTVAGQHGQAAASQDHRPGGPREAPRFPREGASSAGREASCGKAACLSRPRARDRAHHVQTAAIGPTRRRDP